MDEIQLLNLPFPPQANHRLIPSRGRLIKSPESRHYDKSVDVWMIRQRSGLFEIRRKAKEWIDVGFMLQIELFFYWPKEKLISKNGMPKKTDLDNRIKPMIDAISDIIDLDDKYIISLSAHKMIWDKSYQEAKAIITTAKWDTL